MSGTAAQPCVVAGFSAVLLARIVDWQAAPIQRADVVTASYTIFEEDRQDASKRTPVMGHENVVLSSSELDAAVFDSLQTGDPRWTVDAQGYNFRFQPSAAVAPPFPVAGRAYLVLLRLTPLVGDDLPAQWRLVAV